MQIFSASQNSPLSQLPSGLQLPSAVPGLGQLPLGVQLPLPSLGITHEPVGLVALVTQLASESLHGRPLTQQAPPVLPHGELLERAHSPLVQVSPDWQATPLEQQTCPLLPHAAQKFSDVHWSPAPQLAPAQQCCPLAPHKTTHVPFEQLLGVVHSVPLQQAWF